MPSDFALGKNSVPHITLVQFEAQRAPQDYWEMCQKIATPAEVALGGLTFLPAKDGSMWVEVSVFRSHDLWRCQDSLLAVLAGHTLHNGVGDFFRPHVTVAHALNGFSLLKPWVVEATRAAQVPVRLALGRSDDTFQLREIFARC